MEDPALHVDKIEQLGFKNRVWRFTWMGVALLQIELTRGLFGIADDTEQVREELRQNRYHARECYIGSWIDGRHQFLHNRLLDRTSKESDGITADHYNRMGLDCRKCNLRLLTKRQQALNHNLRSDNKTHYRSIRLQNPKNPAPCWTYTYYKYGKGRTRCFSFTEATKLQKLAEAVAFRDGVEAVDDDFRLVKSTPMGYFDLPKTVFGSSYEEEYEDLKRIQRHTKSDQRNNKV
ncbi:MAG: hypothetical protein P4L69_05085 [Desulfosporosinus sp.]|nr:hypothetical protein [Desulfosporosinus sp.]